MARIRTIKPEFFMHEGLAELSPLHRLLFIGLWTLADKDGRLDDRPKRIKATLFPYDKAEVDQMLSDLDRAGFIARYQSFGTGPAIEILKFTEHQRITGKESQTASEIEAFQPEKHRGNTWEAPGKHPDAQEGKGKEGKGKERIYVEQARPGSVQCQELFAYWQTIHGHPRAKLDDDLAKVVEEALRTFSLDDLKRAVDGCKVSPHHQGQNDKQTVYDDLELICRDAKHVNAFIAFAEKGLVRPKSSHFVNRPPPSVDEEAQRLERAMKAAGLA